MNTHHLPDNWLLTGPRSHGDTWHTRHNLAVQAYRRRKVGAMATISPAELGILAMADGIEQLVHSWGDMADPLSGEALFDICSGFHGLLNYNLGRLDAGTLDAWRIGVLERWGVDPDTGAWVGEA